MSEISSILQTGVGGDPQMASLNASYHKVQYWLGVGF